MSVSDLTSLLCHCLSLSLVSVYAYVVCTCTCACACACVDLRQDTPQILVLNKMDAYDESVRRQPLSPLFFPTYAPSLPLTTRRFSGVFPLSLSALGLLQRKMSPLPAPCTFNPFRGICLQATAPAANLVHVVTLLNSLLSLLPAHPLTCSRLPPLHTIPAVGHLGTQHDAGRQ